MVRQGIPTIILMRSSLWLDFLHLLHFNRGADDRFLSSAFPTSVRPWSIPGQVDHTKRWSAPRLLAGKCRNCITHAKACVTYLAGSILRIAAIRHPEASRVRIRLVHIFRLPPPPAADRGSPTCSAPPRPPPLR